jgi:hypothetical protein
MSAGRSQLAVSPPDSFGQEVELPASPVRSEGFLLISGSAFEAGELGDRHVPRTDRADSRLKSWKMNPNRRSLMSAAGLGQFPRRCPSRWIDPLVGLRSAPIIESRVVLPEPDGPMIRRSARPTARLTRARRRTGPPSPKRFVTSRTSSVRAVMRGSFRRRQPVDAGDLADRQIAARSAMTAAKSPTFVSDPTVMQARDQIRPRTRNGEQAGE